MTRAELDSCRYKDISGAKFGFLTAIEPASFRPTKWKCICECGNYHVVQVSLLNAGRVRSCGCSSTKLWMMATTPEQRRQKDYNWKLKGCSKKFKGEYYSWKGMIYRCGKQSSKAYKYYGARGISVCDRWQQSFLNFMEDMGPRPSKDHSIDRIDNNGNYEPGNCRWADDTTQSYNKRNTIIRDGKTLLEISSEYNIPISVLRDRARRNVSNEVFYSKESMRNKRGRRHEK